MRGKCKGIRRRADANRDFSLAFNESIFITFNASNVAMINITIFHKDQIECFMPTIALIVIDIIFQ